MLPWPATRRGPRARASARHNITIVCEPLGRGRLSSEQYSSYLSEVLLESLSLCETWMYWPLNIIIFFHENNRREKSWNLSSILFLMNCCKLLGEHQCPAYLRCDQKQIIFFICVACWWDSLELHVCHTDVYLYLLRRDVQMLCILYLEEWQQRPKICSEDRSAAVGRRIWNEYFVSPTQPGFWRCCC